MVFKIQKKMVEIQREGSGDTNELHTAFRENSRNRKEDGTRWRNCSLRISNSGLSWIVEEEQDKLDRAEFP